MTGIAGIGAVPPINVNGPNALTGVGGASAPGGAAAVDGSQSTTAPGSSFVNALGDALGQLNGQLVTADSSMANFAAGGSADLHTVMLQMDEASLGLKLGVQVRDKLLEAYQEIMRTQL